MAEVTFTIPNAKLPLFIEAFELDYDKRVANEELDGVTRAQYAKQNAFKFLADRARAFHKQKAQDAIVEIDITQ